MIANLYGGFLKPERYAGDLCLDAGGGVQSITCTPAVQSELVATAVENGGMVYLFAFYQTRHALCT